MKMGIFHPSWVEFGQKLPFPINILYNIES